MKSSLLMFVSLCLIGLISMGSKANPYTKAPVPPELHQKLAAQCSQAIKYIESDQLDSLLAMYSQQLLAIPKVVEKITKRHQKLHARTNKHQGIDSIKVGKAYYSDSGKNLQISTRMNVTYKDQRKRMHICVLGRTAESDQWTLRAAIS